MPFDSGGWRNDRDAVRGHRSGWRRCAWRDFGLDFSAMLPQCHLQIVGLLQVQPRLGVAAEISREADCRVGSDATPLPNYIVDAGRSQVQRIGERIRRHAEGCQIFLPEDFTRVDGTHAISKMCHNSTLSVVVDDLDRFGVPVAPALFGHARDDHLAGQRVADEDDAAVVS